MGFSPCPCMSLQRGCQILAMIDAILNMLTLGLYILAFIAYIRDDVDEDYTESEKNVGMISVGIGMILCLMRIGLAFRLYYGAIRRDRKQCRIWLIITFIVTTINIIIFIVNMAASEFNGSSLAGSLIGIIYNIYEMLVVFAFLRELKRDQVIADSIGYAVTVDSPRGLQLQHPPPYITGEPQTTLYIIPASQPQSAYPMQQYSTVNNSYPAPVHHVTRT